MSRACPHCRSPARGNPCWYATDMSPERYRTFCNAGAEPPCLWDADREYERESRIRNRRARERMVNILVGIAAATVASFIYLAIR